MMKKLNSGNLKAEMKCQSTLGGSAAPSGDAKYFSASPTFVTLPGSRPRAECRLLDPPTKIL
jgi:hypothetical protein